MKTYLLEGTMTALTSVSHIGNTHGVNARLRREKLAMPDGTVEEVPIISGNALRGILRDRGMYHMLRTLGYGVNEETGEVQGLSLATFYFLFSGGALTKTPTRGLNVAEGRRWRELIPLVSIFGGALGNYIMDGKARVGKAYPICAETAHLIPARYADGAPLVSVWDLIQEEAYTRRDDEKNEHLRQLIAPEERLQLEAKATEKRTAQEAGAELETEVGQHQQMRYHVETLCAGTRFYWYLELVGVNDLEFDAAMVTLAEWGRAPYIGGKGGVGHGRVALKFESWIEIDPRLAPDGKEISVALGMRYMQHLQERGDEIREALGHAI